MSIEEAIEKLVNARYADEFQGDEDLTTAHLMAIKALEAIPKIREELSDLLATDNELFGISDALRVIDKYIPKE